jgi:phosphoribosylglycinamide formyltransferase-1
MQRRLRLGLLASHEGTTLQAILDACAAGTLAARVAVVLSNNSASGALRRARAAYVDTVHLSTKTHPDPALLDAAIVAALKAQDVELVVLAGYMRKLGPATLGAFRGRVINTHPALLPKFGGPGMYGMRVYEAVLAAKEHVTGPSVHAVEADYDSGAVLAQREVAVTPGDTPETLARRVQARERELLVSVIAEFASGQRQLPIANAD